MSSLQPTAEQTYLEHVWQSALGQYTSGSTDIVLPIAIQGSIGHDGVLTIMQRFSAFTGHPANLSLDDALGTFRITRGPTAGVQNPVQGSHSLAAPQNATQNLYPSAESQEVSAAPLPSTPTAIEDTSAPRKASARFLSKDRVPRPPNAFILYRQHHHPFVKAANPGMHNNSISIILGKKWKDEPAEVKSHFKTLSEQIKHKHYLDHPEYQYHPRKSSEKKRRGPHRKVNGSTSTNAVPTFQPVTSGAPAGGITQFETMPSANAESPSLTAALLESFNLTAVGSSGDAQGSVATSVAASVPATADNTDHSPGHQGAIIPDDTSSTGQRETTDRTTSEVTDHYPVDQNASITNATDVSSPAQQESVASTTSEPSDHTVGDNQNAADASDASSITQEQSEIDLASILTEDAIGLGFPFTGLESDAVMVLEDWNEQQLFDAGFPSGLFPLMVETQAAAQDPDYHLVNWAEIDLRARLEFLDDEQDFLRMFPGQQ